jgi:hypothetical protein
VVTRLEPSIACSVIHPCKHAITPQHQLSVIRPLKHDLQRLAAAAYQSLPCLRDCTHAGDFRQLATHLGDDIIRTDAALGPWLEDHDRATTVHVFRCAVSPWHATEHARHGLVAADIAQQEFLHLPHLPDRVIESHAFGTRDRDTEGAAILIRGKFARHQLEQPEDQQQRQHHRDAEPHRIDDEAFQGTSIS